MEYAIQASGAICGWIFIEFVFAACFKTRIPISFNFGMACVGAVIATALFIK
jgi:hypothetical protein